MQADSRYVCLMMLALAMVVVTACSPAEPAAEPGVAACPESWDQVTEYRLYFGRSDATGTPDAVTDADWAQFLEDTVTPRFPGGLTVTDGAGQWQAGNGEILKEGSKVLTLLVWPNETAVERLDEIAAEYERRFNQESVLLTSSQTCASFS